MTTLSMRQASIEFKQNLQQGKVPQPIAEWIAQRCAHKETDKHLPLLFLVFQDYMLELAVGKNTQDTIQIVEEQFIQGE